MIDVYDKNAETKSPKRALLLHKMSLISEVVLIGGFIAYIYVALLHFTNPIYGYFWEHEFKALFPLYIPFIDEKSVQGFTILMSIQTIEALTAAVGSGCTDFPFMIAIFNIWIFIAFFKDDTNELNLILRDERADMTLATTQLQNIFKSYNEIWANVFVYTKLTTSLIRLISMQFRAIDNINTAFFLNNFVVILCAAIATAVELFTCLKVFHQFLHFKS